MDADAATGKFAAVADEVIGLGLDTCEVRAVQQVYLVVFGSSEGMVRGVPTFLLRVPLEEGEVDDEGEGKGVGVGETEAMSHLLSQSGQGRDVWRGVRRP